MAYRTPGYPASYGQSSMPMPNMPTSYTQASSYSTTSARSYPATTAPYPTSSSSSHSSQPTTQYPSSVSRNVDAAMDQLIKNLTSLINNATINELQEMVDNEDRINQLVEDAEGYKDLKRKREEMTSNNRDKAVTNLSLRPEIDVFKVKLSELCQRQNELRDRYLNQQQKLGSSVSPDSILAILQAAAAENESQSENIKTDFYNGDINIDDFSKKFIEERKLFQLRKIKSEKMDLLLRRGTSISIAPSMNTPRQVAPRPIQYSHPGYPVNQHPPQYQQYQRSSVPQPVQSGYYGSYPAR